MIGTTISHYKIVDQIGAGGMGVVYKAEDTHLKRTVALKFLPASLLGTDIDKDRFILEAQAAAAIDHPNVCTIYEIDTSGEHPFIAMAYIPGESLDAKIATGPLDHSEAVRIALQLCNALDEAHGKDIVHRDIKPANVVFSDKGHAILMDFGLAKLRGHAKLTRAGSTVGTAAYMSPEQSRGESVDPRSDIWSLGVVLFEMLTGDLPFKGDHESAIVYSILNEEPASVRSLRPDVSPELDGVVHKALTKKVDERYQNIDEMRTDLKAVRQQLGGKSTATSVRIPSATRKPRWTLPVFGILALVAVVVVGGLTLMRDQEPIESQESAAPTTGESRSDNSIAVLPLANLSGDAQNTFFVDGMTEELITQLAQIRALKVISRSSVMRYKNTEKPVSEIADELGVSKILEGSVLWAGDRVRISAQLIDGSSDQHIWANSYESDLSDVLGLQRRVAKAVATQIKVALTSQEQARLASTPVVDSEAYPLYLQGRFHWNKRTPESIERAIAYFRMAIEKDSTYARAYSGLAEAHLVQATWAALPSSETFVPGREMAQRALEIDENLASAHAVLGGIACEYDWQWDEAERHYLRAVEANPNYATARQWYAEFLSSMGRADEAIEQIEIAMGLDPLSLIVGCVAGYVRSIAGQRGEALAEFQRVFDLDSLFTPAYSVRSNSFIEFGETDAAVRDYLRYLELTASDDEDRRDVARAHEAFADGGFEGFCRLSIAVLDRNAKRGEYVPPVVIAGIYAMLGEVDSTMVWLERGYEERAINMHMLAHHPWFRTIRTEPRFLAMLQRLGLQTVN